ncbi:glycosyltransferase [Cyanobium sp. ATX 6A2]|uniref:glycosyltransferase n=1 Tax=Cyanobium sp. ATX 6A2 TaxID=2823700 RepID=UPI0020CF808C|nr:glycosyltransferase [Cyanobium sp. ATX 6A2]MCP9889262.1 glycosyltransferase [Cyanobium sp. ATX 6A2]
MNHLIKRFYEDLSSGNRAGAEEVALQIKALEVPEVLVESLHFVMGTLIQGDQCRDSYPPPNSYYNKKIARGVNEKAPVTRIETCPLVSIIIVSYNSSQNLRELLPSIKSQTYTEYEIILVENGSEDNESLLAEAVDNYVYIQVGDNVGYAEGNNIGASRSRGEYLLLLNPDTRLGEDAIKEMLRGISHESSHALAACPKIYFYREFIRVWIKNSPGDCRLDLEAAVNKLEYRKIFIRNGTSSPCGRYVWPDEQNCICIDFPSPEERESISLEILPLESDDKATGNQITGKAEVYIGDNLEAKGLIEIGRQFEITRTSQVKSMSRRIINNAGSGMDKMGMAFDRGFSDEDRPEYSTLTHVDAFCGCCVLIHRLAWVARQLFCPYFFAYFEDTELSYWMKLHHYQILYCPTSIVYHRHSETTQESSPNWAYLVGRSRTLYQWMTGSIVDTSYAQELINKQLSDKASPHLIEKIQSLYPTDGLAGLKRSQKRETITVAVYNSYWTTMGGGEKHALDIASRISEWEGHEVYLLSEHPFDIKKLAQYFAIDLGKCISLQLNEINSLTTGFFDIFINSTYCSLLLPRALRNYYIVSFPTRTMPEELIAAYTFLHNSNFTHEWATRYWGTHSATVVYPVLGCEVETTQAMKKQKVIASVGRFNFHGHCKNQHLIIKAYNLAKQRGGLGSEWKLIVAGSVDNSILSSVNHYEECQKLIEDETVVLIPNADRNTILRLYSNAFAYVHGTGLGIDVEANPELCEHFGISVFDALANNCIPFVHNSGGAKDILSQASRGMLYNNIDELIMCFATLDSLYEQQALERHGSSLTKSIEMAQQAVKDNRALFRKVISQTDPSTQSISV